MSEPAVLWILGTLVAALFALVGIVWHSLDQRISRAEQEIGRSHEEGLRGGVHRCSNELTGFKERIRELEHKVDGLEERER